MIQEIFKSLIGKELYAEREKYMIDTHVYVYDKHYITVSFVNNRKKGVHSMSASISIESSQGTSTYWKDDDITNREVSTGIERGPVHGKGSTDNTDPIVLDIINRIKQIKGGI